MSPSPSIAFRFGLGRFPVVLSLALAVWAAGSARAYRAEEFRQETVRSGEFVYLAVPHERQEAMYCVPTSALMIIRYYGRAAGQDLLAGLFSQGSQNRQGTKLHEVTGALGRIGYTWKLESRKVSASDYKDHWAAVRAELDGRRPVIVAGVTPSGNYHAVVLVGYDAKRGRVFLMDPSSRTESPYPGAWILSETAFRRFWEHTNSRYWITTAPPAGPPAVTPAQSVSPSGAGSATAVPAAPAPPVDEARMIALLKPLLARLSQEPPDPKRIEAVLGEAGWSFERADLLRADQRSRKSLLSDFVRDNLIGWVKAFQEQQQIPVAVSDESIVAFLPSSNRSQACSVLVQPRNGQPEQRNLLASQLATRVVFRDAQGNYALLMYCLRPPQATANFPVKSAGVNE